jgi:hypothetical protein
LKFLGVWFQDTVSCLTRLFSLDAGNNDDTGFKELLLWKDKNSDHGTDAGELKSLEDAGIASLNTGYQALPDLQNGNLVLERSVATWADGRSMEMVDVYFRGG